MYLSFYRLKHKPFQISTDPRFLWLGEKHEEALSTLEYGVLDNKGFLLLTGDVGTGKTTLINALLHKLDKNTLAAFIRDPALEPMDFFQYMAHAFGMKASNINTKGSFLIQFEEFLLEAYESRRKVILIIDEAQRMSQQLLEEVRLLSNMEREDSKLINIFFIGQLEFNDILLGYENKAIRQRITLNYNIEPLSEEETEEYILHRLEVASSNETVGFFAPLQKNQNGELTRHSFKLPLPEVKDRIFSDDAISQIFKYSKGFPRLINIICDRALLTGFVEGASKITAKHIEECEKELALPKNLKPVPGFDNTAPGAHVNAAACKQKTGKSIPEPKPQSEQTRMVDEQRIEEKPAPVPRKNETAPPKKAVVADGKNEIVLNREQDADVGGEIQNTREMVDELARLVKYADEIAKTHEIDVHPKTEDDRNGTERKRSKVKTLVWCCVLFLLAGGMYIFLGSENESVVQLSRQVDDPIAALEEKNIQSAPERADTSPAAAETEKVIAENSTGTDALPSVVNTAHASADEKSNVVNLMTFKASQTKLVKNYSIPIAPITPVKRVDNILSPESPEDVSKENKESVANLMTFDRPATKLAKKNVMDFEPISSIKLADNITPMAGTVEALKADRGDQARLMEFDGLNKKLEKKEIIHITAIAPVKKVAELEERPAVVLDTLHKKSPPNAGSWGSRKGIGSTLSGGTGTLAPRKVPVSFTSGGLIPSSQTLEELNSIADDLSECSTCTILVVYYTSHDQFAAEKIKQAELQANIVKSYLMGRGIEDSRIIVQNVQRTSYQTVVGSEFEANGQVEVRVTI